MRATLVTMLLLGVPLVQAAEPVGRAAGPPVELLSAAGLRETLAANRGKVVVLNFWATWCTSCLREIPDLMQLEREARDRGIVLVAVAMDDPAEIGTVAAFRDRFFPQFHTWLRREPEMDGIASVVDPAFNELLPTTYLIGRDGRVAKRIQGKRTLEDFRAEVASLQH